MTRFLVRLLLAIGVVFMLACMGLIVPFQFFAVLCLGWIPYLYRVLPQVRVDRSDAAMGVVCLVLATVGLHLFASWFYEQTRGLIDADRPVALHWRKRWTGWIIGGVLLMFIAGLATVGITHQVAWLMLLPEKLVSSGGTREITRRMHSANNLKQVGSGLHAYLQAHDSFPPAATLDQLGRPLYGWQAMILPFIEQSQLHDRIDFRVPWDDVRNFAPYQALVDGYLRPGIDRKTNAKGYALSHYAGNVSMLGGVVPRTPRDVSDGTANTIMAGEVNTNFKPWGDPTNWRDPALGVNKTPNGFGSPSPGGANFLFVDGSVRFLTDKIEPRILKALSTPAGAEKIGTDEY